MRKTREGFCSGCIQLKPLTADHIIPQAIGGKLEVPICGECHRKIYPIDTELTKGLHKIATLLKVKRERKKNRSFRVKQVSTGDEFDIDSNTARRARPEVAIQLDQDGHPKPDVTARSKEELLDILSRIQEKYGKVSQEVEALSSPIPIGLVEYSNTVGGRLFMRSVAKTAYLLLASRLPEERISSRVFDPIRDFIFDDKGDSLTSFNFAHTKFMSDDRRPLHGIVIHFDSQKRNIIGYVQYLGVLRFSVLIARYIPWEIAVADLKYCLDPVTGNQIPLKFEFMLPDRTSDDCVHPLQTIQFVHSEIARGLKNVESYCDKISATRIEFIGFQ